MKLVFDEHSFKQVARALLVMNPRIGSSVQSVVDYMKRFAEMHLDKPTFAGTLGFYVVGYTADNDPDTLHVIAVVMGYTAQRYLVEQGAEWKGK